jgi:hypothetical protein
MIAKRERANSTAFPWRWAGALYSVLFLAAFAFPGGLVDWLDDRNSTGWLSAPLAIATGIDAVSTAVGVKMVGVELRRRFTTAIGEGET